MSAYYSASRRAAVCLLVTGAWTAMAFGQDVPKEEPPAAKPARQANGIATTKPPSITDPADLEAFFDGAINVQLESKHIAGAVVAIVAGDKLVFAKGYGYADFDKQRPVDPEKTLFRVASISKLFTWTAVMQQLEEGKLDLDTDINTYMKDVKIPPTFEQPITLKHILTHTPGFEDNIIGLFAHKASEVRPLAEVLNAQMPKRVRPPGVLASYSNHGTAMAGYAVACVAGIPWEDYIEQRILKPLGMEHTSVRQPAEDELPADLSKGYKWEKGHFAVQGFEYCPAAPAGCISMSAADAAKFMIAHLNDGERGGKRILKPETARRMREPLFRHDPKVSAMCYGFMEDQQNGLRMVGHGGDTVYFHSLMQLIPEKRVGLFVSYNTDTSGGIREILFDAFLRRYYPESDPPKTAAESGFRERAARLTGEYVVTRYSHSTVTKLSSLLAAFDVSANDDSLTVSMGDSTRRYVEVEPLVFRSVDGTSKIVFQEGKDGRVLYLYPFNAPPVSAIRRTWYESSLAQWGLLGGSAAIFATAVLFWPVIAFSVRGLQSPRIKRTRFSAFLSCLAWCMSVAGIGFVVGMAFVMKEPTEVAFGLTPLLKALMAATPICAVLAALTVIACLLAWWNRYWRFTGRLHYTLVALAGVGFTWFLYNWNMLQVGIGGMRFWR